MKLRIVVLLLVVFGLFYCTSAHATHIQFYDYITNESVM